MITHGVTNSKNQTLEPGLMLTTVQMTAEQLLLEKNVLTGKFSYNVCYEKFVTHLLLYTVVNV